MALHDFVVKVTVFMKAVDSSVILSEDNALIFTQYANALAEQGLLVTAAKYCRGSSLESKILRDRLYRSRESPGCLSALGSAPEFPFSLVQVKTAPAGATAVQRRQQPQSYTNQNQTLQHAASQSHSAYGTQQQAQSVSVSNAVSMSFELSTVPYLTFFVSYSRPQLQLKHCPPDGSRCRIRRVVEHIMQTRQLVNRRGRYPSQWPLLQRRYKMLRNQDTQQ
jgi:hypothetical protein